MDNPNGPYSKGLKVWLPLFFSAVLVGGMVIGMKLNPSPSPVAVANQDVYVPTPRQSGKLEEMLRYMEAKYVDVLDREELEEKAITHLLSQMDPHSNYISVEQLTEVNEQLDGSFEGIGIEFMFLEDTILVVTPLAGGPAESVGILAGDKIVEIEDSIVAGNNAMDRKVINMLRGKKDSEVKVGILRGDASKVQYFTITRDKIPMNSVDIGYMINDKTGYIKVSRFSANTYREFMEELERMVEKEGMKDLIIDLRQNPGGYLNEATNILSQLFKEKDRLLVYTEGRTVKRSEYESTGKAYFPVGDIAVLIDEGSASASEIIAGAIQDWDRGVIIGRRSFGKGLVQEQYSLKDGSALRLTVARYYTPSGRSIQKSYDDMEAYDKDVYNRYSSGEMYSKDSINIVDTTKYFTMLEKRPVYGGGGVTPDIFVPLDSVIYNEDYLTLRKCLPEFAYRFVENHKEELNYNLREFNSLYAVTEPVLEELINYASQRFEKTIDRTEIEETVVDHVKYLLKARIARQLYGEKGLFTILNSDDTMVEKALNAFRLPNPLTYK